MMFLKEVFAFAGFCFLLISRANLRTVEEEFEKQSSNLRPGFISSLFPHVAPYVKFSASSAQPLPTELRQGLKWAKPSKPAPEDALIEAILENTGIPYRNCSKSSSPWFGSWQHRAPTSSRQKPSVRKPLLTAAYQKYNRVPGDTLLGDKAKLWQSARKAVKKFRSPEFPFLLPTYVLPAEMAGFRKAWAAGENKEWALKAPQGGGVRIINNPSQVINGTDSKTIVAQKYLSSPYLHKGRRVDFRFYALMTDFHPLRLYLSYGGIGSTKLSVYSNSSLTKFPAAVNASKDLMLTNREGFEKLFSPEVKLVLKERIEDAVIKTFLLAEPELKRLGYSRLLNHYSAFQLFSFDFLLDDRLNVWLNKVNTVPLFGPPSNSTKTKNPSSSLIFLTEVLNVAGYHLPPTLSSKAKASVYKKDAVLDTDSGSDPTFQEQLYTFDLSAAERQKAEKYEGLDIQYRQGYLDSILGSLTAADVRQLVVAEDELNRASMYGRSFKRILPSISMHKYLRLVGTGVYPYMLQDAWESRVTGSNRTEARKLLFQYTSRKIHLQ